MNSLISTTEAQSGFYPTPKSVAYQLFDMIDTQPIREVLEPPVYNKIYKYAL